MAATTTTVMIRPTDGWVQVVFPLVNPNRYTQVLIRPHAKRQWYAFAGPTIPANTQTPIGIPFNTSTESEGFGQLYLAGGTTSAVWVRVLGSQSYDNDTPTPFGVFLEDNLP